MKWNAVVTNAGIEMLNESISGKKLTITGATGGTGTAALESLVAQTALVNEKQEFSLLGMDSAENGKRIKIQITSVGLSTGYTLNQVGIWAKLENGVKQLLAVFQDETGISVPSQSDLPEFLLEFFAVIEHSQEAQMEINIDPAAYVSNVTLNEKINAHNQSGSAHADIRALIDGLDYISASDRGVAGGVASLDNTGKIPTGQIPSLNYDSKGSAASVLAELNAHLNDDMNPHGVTAAQINAVPITRYINGKDLASDITLTPGDVGAVPTSRLINGKALSSNINLTPTDIGVTAKRTCRFVVGTSTNGWTQDDCDYLCDGVDDQVEIQAAIDALPALGGEIVILRGDYHMTDNLILKDNVAIRGELNYWPNSQINYASRVTLQKQGSARKIIKGADKVVLENIFTIMYELNFANSCQAIIRNCNMWITGKLTNTLIENSSGNLTFENLTYSSIVNHNGSIFISSGDNVNIDGGQNILGNSGSISLSGVSNSIVSNIVYENTSHNGPIITIAGGSHNNIIIGNIINKNYEDAMWNQFGAIYVYGNAYNNLIYGNKLKVGEVANAHSILFDSSTHDNIVMGNSFIKYNYSNAGTNNQFINNFVYDEVTSA